MLELTFTKSTNSPLPSVATVKVSVTVSLTISGNAPAGLSTVTVLSKEGYEIRKLITGFPSKTSSITDKAKSSLGS